MSSVVCILAAGSGTRLGPWGRLTHKALLPVDKKAALTHILEKFPRDTRFVVAIGHRGELIREYMQVAHPDTQVDFVEVNPYAGPGSGPGTSLRACASKLQQSFFVVCADTLWSETLPLDANFSWVATARVPLAQSESYCLVEHQNGIVTGFRDKQGPQGKKDPEAFTGLFYVHRPQEFFDGLKLSQSVRGEHQLSEGLESLVQGSGLRLHNMTTWTDIGTFEKYVAVRSPSPIDMSKSGEAFYMVKDRVIKFFENSQTVENRVQRSRLAKGKLPAIAASTKHFYSYHYIYGRTLYEINDPQLLRPFLDWMEKDFWPLQEKAPATFPTTCRDFYFSKTQDRLNLYRSRFQDQKDHRSVNGQQVLPTDELLKQVAWDEMQNPIPAAFHGDLQFGNIIFDASSSRFQLIDWRQNFAGDLVIGDLYYDLAKMYSGFLVDLHAVEQGHFSFQQNDRDIAVEMPRIQNFSEYHHQLSKYCQEKNISFSKVRILAALILLNIAPLYSDELAQAFFHLGRIDLQKALRDKATHLYVA